MPLSLRVIPADGWLVVEASGPAQFADFIALIGQVSAEADRVGAKRMLVDLRQVVQDLKLTEHIMFSERAVMALERLEKIASVVKPIDRRGTSERAARDRHVKLRVFSDRAEAEAWLAE